MTPPKQLTFSAVLGKRNWERIAAKHERLSGPWLDEARAVAAMIAKRTGSVTADDVVRQIGPCSHPPAHGAIFARLKDGPKWQKIGWEPSKRPTSNASSVFRWKVSDA